MGLVEEHSSVERKTNLNRFRMSLGSWVLLAGLVSVFGAAAWTLLQTDDSPPTSGHAPDFTVTTFDGEEITLSKLRGNIVVLNFWGSWCGPCREEAPDLQAIYERYADQGVIVLGLTYMDDPVDSIAMIDELNLTYPNAQDYNMVIAQDKYHIQGAPDSFIIDRDGKIHHFQYGPITENMLDDILRDLLNESA